MHASLLLLSAVFSVSVAYSAPAYVWPDCDPKTDGHAPYDPAAQGPFSASFLNTSFNSHMLYALVPAAKASNAQSNASLQFPALLFMHGSTGQWEMYSPNLELYASHGFIVVFPFIKNPEADKNPLTTNTDGKFLLNALDFVKHANSDSGSPLFGLVDTDNVVMAGHSMGATCAIAAGKAVTAMPGNGGVKLVITQHPGICGPFGPPPLPSTWMPSDLATVNRHLPFLLTTAQHEWGCFNKTMAALGSPQPNPNLFVQFSTAACGEDSKRQPFKDQGHNCPFKDNVETPWFTTAIKLFAHHNGSTHTTCANMLYGSHPTTSLQGDPNVQHSVVHPPPF